MFTGFHSEAAIYQEAAFNDVLVAILGFPRQVLDACLFEPGQWQAEFSKQVPSMVPAPTRAHLATPCGLLFNELCKSPTNIVASVEKMLELILEYDTGRFSDGVSYVILYVIRIVIQVCT